MSSRRVRRAVLSALDRSELLRTTVVRSAASLALRRGAIDEVVAEAVDRASERGVERTLQMIAWATTATRPGWRPRHLVAGEHLVTRRARDAAAAALRPAANPTDVDARRQLIHVDDHLTSEQRGELIHDALSDAILRRATSPRKGSGIDPATQRRIVQAVTACLADTGIRPFLMSGSLLGVVRDGDFLPYDYDVDLGVLPDTDLDVVDARLRGEPDFDVVRQETRIVISDRTGARADLFPHRLDGGLFWHETDIHRWWNTPFGLARLELAGDSIWIPDDPHRYLEENYGDWGRPAPFYEITFDTPNREYRENADAMRFLYEACASALERGDRWTAESAARELRDHFGIDVTDRLGASVLLDRSPAEGQRPSARDSS